MVGGESKPSTEGSEMISLFVGESRSHCGGGEQTGELFSEWHTRFGGREKSGFGDSPGSSRPSHFKVPVSEKKDFGVSNGERNGERNGG